VKDHGLVVAHWSRSR